ncbi:D-dopachrome decarboxylase-A-like [Sipha flava]|uniref:L-dopachrome isomerase n=1 Tax=Sipha flava TaxID=143950 RepID=A0A8B8GGF5_9HEMI|nr:D-dopachrome decarboxylase-A-like [Sipha flava]
MPILQIDSNLSKSNVPKDFRVKTCELMADIFKSPINFCVVHMNMEQDMYWYGLVSPCILGTLKIIDSSGIISPKQNIGHAEILVKHISDNLKIPNNNISISFVEQDAENVTIFNTTVSNFLQNKNSILQ